MQVQLTKPELRQFVDEKVKAGEFPSADAVVEDALTRMMEEEQILTEQDLKAIDSADEQMNRGEHVEFETFAREMRKKYSGR